MQVSDPEVDALVQACRYMCYTLNLLWSEFYRHAISALDCKCGIVKNNQECRKYAMLLIIIISISNTDISVLSSDDDDDELMLNVLRCHLTY